jgi:hypothetical protein
MEEKWSSNTLYQNQLNATGGWVWLLPLLWFAGGMWGNGKCQKRGRESLPVAVRWEYSTNGYSSDESLSHVI